MLRVFATHDPGDLAAYYGRALPELRAIDGVDVVLNPLDRNLSTPELIEYAAGCEIIVAHRATPGEAALFDQRPELLAMLRTAVDISTIDVAAASRAGVLVAHADKSFVASTAELALGLLLAVARNVAESTVDYRAGHEPPQRTGFQLHGKTAGLIGYGSIARHLAPILRAMGLTVLVCDPYTDDAVADGFEQIALDDLLGRCEIVMPLAASTPETANLIDAAALARMRPGAVLVNVSRGELFDDAAVAAALDSGQLGGLAIDVGRAPDQRPASLLASRPGVVATPHLGGLTPDNADAQAFSSVEQVRAIAAGEVPPRSVNHDVAERLRRWNSQRR